jgi:25S rRNA (cytosine2870-C5)-methyltransferase
MYLGCPLHHFIHAKVEDASGRKVRELVPAKLIFGHDKDASQLLRLLIANLKMGVGRRMKKQGPPASLEELGFAQKRKAGYNETQNGPAKKRRKSDAANSPKKLVKLDRALRQGKDAIAIKRKKSKPSRAINEDAQITVPPAGLPPAESEEDDQELLNDSEFDDSELDIEAEEVVVGKLDELTSEDSDSDSVFDSDEENQPKGMFSEDEDESDAEEKLTAANMEGLSRKLDKVQADADAAAQQELEEDALQTNIAGDEGVLDGQDAAAPGLAPDLQLLRSRITETIRILSDFSKLAADGKSRADYTTLLLSDICTYYGYTPYLAEKLFNLFTPMEAFAFFEANETPRPVVLRTNTLRTNRRTLAQALINRGVVLEPVGKWSKVGLQVFESAVPLGATPEYLAGHYILQAASSFLPVMALAPQPNERVLDMAAAPGGKTTYISALMRNTGTVFANDANRQRAKGLIGNIHRLGCKNVIVSNLDAKAFPKAVGGFDRVLLDAPCSGTGVIGKDPSVKTSKTERDFLMLPHMQKQLLLAAIDSVDHASKTGGYVVYSTCSVTVEENEGVVQYALRKRPNVRIVETGLGTFGSEGFKSYMGKKFDARMNMTRRYFPHRENVDGFFVCKLKKTGPTPKSIAAATNGDAEPVEQTHGALPAKKSKANSVKDEAADEEDAFGGFDDEEDSKYIESAEKKRLRRKGLDPRTASMNRKKVTHGKSKAKKAEQQKTTS